jgi:hypothetical protein
VLILEDNAYDMIRWDQEADQFPDFGLEFGNPDLVATRNPRRDGGAGSASEVDGLVAWRQDNIAAPRAGRTCRIP